MGNLRGIAGTNNIAKAERRAPVRRVIPQAVGARFFNRYAESVQLYWDAPGPNPKGSFLQGTLHPGANLGMKSYVGHCFHAEVAGETVWSVKVNAKQRQFYNIDRSQKAVCTQDLLEAFSFKDKAEAAPVANPFSSSGASPFGMAPAATGATPFAGFGASNPFSAAAAGGAAAGGAAAGGAPEAEDEMDL